MLAVGMDLDSYRVGVMLAEDRWVEMVRTEGRMFQESGGTDSDGREPMASEERVAQGDWTA